VWAWTWAFAYLGRGLTEVKVRHFLYVMNGQRGGGESAA
jgi:hypothetical protein